MIRISNLSKRFGHFSALKNINLDLKKGESIALIGPNGCGKTTLIKSILGLNVVEEGQILVNGKSVMEDHHYREVIGYMPQIGKYPENMTIGQTIAMIKTIRNIPEHELDTELLEAFEIPSIAEKKMGTLSGGTTQKVSAVLAFMFRPDIIILDEPTAGLDPIASEILKQKIIKEKNQGKLIIITSHLLSELEEIITEIVFMNEGEIIVHQPVESIKAQTQSNKVSEAIIQILKQIRYVQNS